MDTFDRKRLVGIPFKNGGGDINGCDCRTLCYLYHQFVHGKKYPYTDDGDVSRRRDKKKDNERMHNVLKNFSTEVTFIELKEGDVVLMKSKHHCGVLGVCYDNMYILCMHPVYGSMLMKKDLLKDKFIRGYRIAEKTT